MSKPFRDILDTRIGRRHFTLGLAASALSLTLLKPARLFASLTTSLSFKELPHKLTTGLDVPEGYAAQVLIRWGDAVLSGAPPFDPANQSVNSQKLQFGYNNDFIAYMPLPRGSNNSEHGLLCVNHEYTLPHLMFAKDASTKEQHEIEMAAHGHSVIEVRKMPEGWQVVEGDYNRRFNALDTVFAISGPAAGHDRLKTSKEASGRSVIGTLNNCAGGFTPWGTVLVSEENFNDYFGGKLGDKKEALNYKYLDIDGKPKFDWAKTHSRFDLASEPREANRFGWIWEYDPYDPNSIPTKRTALGRFKHECATTTLLPDGRLAIYSGDDEVFQFVYRFVSNSKVSGDPAENKDLLDSGTLYAARFDKDGSMEWLPLVYGTAPLTAENGFRSQADVLIETRRAAELMGATPMDRPEDIEVHPETGDVYVVLTNNYLRLQRDAANPRRVNRHGHIIQLKPPEKDHAASRYAWDIFLLAGEPGSGGAWYPGELSESGWLSCPDNITFDASSRLWIATDGQQRNTGYSESLYVAETSGTGRGITRHFLNAPTGAEVTGPCFTPDGRNLFLSIQHPADDNDSDFNNPSTRWPDFDAKLPPRPSVIVVSKKDGDVIGN